MAGPAAAVIARGHNALVMMVIMRGAKKALYKYRIHTHNDDGNDGDDVDCDNDDNNNVDHDNKEKEEEKDNDHNDDDASDDYNGYAHVGNNNYNSWLGS